MTHTIQAQIAENNVTVQAQIETQIAPSSGIKVKAFSTSKNGTFTAPQGEAFSPVTVDVPVPQMASVTLDENGTFYPLQGQAFSEVTVAVPIKTEKSLSVTKNGTYEPDKNEVYNLVEVDVPNSYAAQDEGKVVNNGALVAQSSRTVTENGTVDTTLNNSVTVNVETYKSQFSGIIDRSIVTAVIPDGTSQIGNSSFYGCNKLVTIEIPDSVTMIDSYAFSGCSSLMELDIPDSVTSIGSYALQNTRSMQKLTFRRLIPASVAASTFTGLSKTCVIHVPYSADHSILNAYKTAANYPNPNTYTYVEDT